MLVSCRKFVKTLTDRCVLVQPRLYADCISHLWLISAPVCS